MNYKWLKRMGWALAAWAAIVGLFLGMGMFMQAGCACTPLKSPDEYVQDDVHLIQKGGHQFAVTRYNNGVSICEVTDASLVRTNLETR